MEPATRSRLFQSFHPGPLPRLFSVAFDPLRLHGVGRKMTIARRAWFGIFLTLSSYAVSQTLATNRLRMAEAVKVVSRLPKGMRQANVVEVLQRKGLPMPLWLQHLEPQ